MMREEETDRQRGGDGVQFGQVLSRPESGSSGGNSSGSDQTARWINVTGRSEEEDDDDKPISSLSLVRLCLSRARA